MKVSFTINHNENLLPYIPPFKATRVELGVNVTGFTTFVLETGEYTKETFIRDLAECWMLGTYMGLYRVAIMNLRIMHTVLNATHMYADAWPYTKGSEHMLRKLLNMVNSLIRHTESEDCEVDDEIQLQLENLSKEIENTIV